MQLVSYKNTTEAVHIGNLEMQSAIHLLYRMNVQHGHQRVHVCHLKALCRTSIHLCSQQQTGSVSHIRGRVVLGCGVWQDTRGEATCDRQVHCGATGAGPSRAPVGIPHGTVHEACHCETMDSSPAQD